MTEQGMTEWNGIKVGGLYKRTAGYLRPLALVVEIEDLPNSLPLRADSSRACLTTLEGGKLEHSFLTYFHQSGIIADACGEWPYTEVAV